MKIPKSKKKRREIKIPIEYEEKNGEKWRPFSVSPEELIVLMKHSWTEPGQEELPKNLRIAPLPSSFSI